MNSRCYEHLVNPLYEHSIMNINYMNIQSSYQLYEQLLHEHSVFNINKFGWSILTVVSFCRFTVLVIMLCYLCYCCHLQDFSSKQQDLQ